MISYIIRRILYAVPVVLGVSVLIFLLFFVYAGGTENIARQVLGPKAKKEAVEAWLQKKGLDKPTWYNASAAGTAKLTETLFAEHLRATVTMDFGASWQDDRAIGEKILERAPASLAIAVPEFVLAFALTVIFSLWLASARGTPLDRAGTIVTVAMMSVSILVYIILSQLLFSIIWRWFPVSGFAPFPLGLRFLPLPILAGLLAGLGGSVRFGRTVMLEELGKEYVRAARARGVPERVILGRHVLKNAMIPLLTSAVLSLPLLVMGSLLIENFFGIPGLGSMGIEAIHSNDFMTLRALTFMTAVLYQFGLILTDISYTLVDPRVRFS